MAPRMPADDPSPRLEAAFRRIARDAMAGVPMLHPGLRVQAVGFERRDGHWLGALVTPWFLNLVLVPADAAERTPARPEGRVFKRFAAGDLAFLGNDEPEVGEFLSCSLFSPMSAFADQAAAVATARAALAMLHVPPPDAAPPPGCAAASATPPPGPAPAAGSPTAQRIATEAPPPSRRAFLLGRRDAAKPVLSSVEGANSAVRSTEGPW